jgi:hypothetical protein
MQKNKISKCSSFFRKLKKSYGCTKKTKVFNTAGWTCCSKLNNDELTTEKVLPILDKEKSYNRKYIMMRLLYTLFFISNVGI